MVGLLAFSLCYAGFAALSMSMTKHVTDHFHLGSTPCRCRAFGLFGWGVLGLSVWYCCAAWGVSVGVVVWAGLATVAIPAVAMSLAVVRQR